jgi:hypothetical protein
MSATLSRESRVWEAQRSLGCAPWMSLSCRDSRSALGGSGAPHASGLQVGATRRRVQRAAEDQYTGQTGAAINRHDGKCHVADTVPEHFCSHNQLPPALKQVAAGRIWSCRRATCSHTRSAAAAAASTKRPSMINGANTVFTWNHQEGERLTLPEWWLSDAVAGKSNHAIHLQL